ncbi:amino acid adenylation domain-containing protein [Delftia sp. WSY_14]|uniref:amino acid adenylation domain-containing protein n=1 Tax=unclassified Delftia TaxID=2613839 RepID=UPI003709D4E3
MKNTEFDIAHRFNVLVPGKRRQFLDALAAQGIDFSGLPIVPAQDGAVTPASYAQARMWFLWKLEPQSAAYHISGAWRLHGALDLDALRTGFGALVARHATLRTVFKAGPEGLPLQCVLEHVEIDIPVVEASQPAVQMQALCNRTFDLETGPLLRVALIREAQDRHLLVVVMHHIVSDGRSMQILVEEFAAQYAAHVQSLAAGLPSLPVQYADYALWQRNWMEAGERDRQLAYWTQQLGQGQDQPVLQLQADHPRRADGRYPAAEHVLLLPRPLVQALKARARAEGATLFMALLAGWQALLARYSGQGDIRVGVPLANRQRAETQGLVGLFVNTQVLRNRIDMRMPMVQVLRQAREAALGAQAHQDLPFDQLVEALQPERNLGVQALFQVMHNHQRTAAALPRQMAGLLLEPCPQDERAAQFELVLNSSESADGEVRLAFSYAAPLFESETIARMAGHCQALLQALAEHPQQALGDVPLLQPQEQRQLAAWGLNRMPAGQGQPVHRSFEAWARRTPDAVALAFGDAALSYGELNRRANLLAHRLMSLGVGLETRVAVAAQRSVEMMVGLLAILKAGGAYVPLDLDYPRERLAYMLQDSGVRLVLCQGPGQSLLPDQHGLQVVDLDASEPGVWPDHDPQVEVDGQNLVYVIYTSGSTGRPKGAANRHDALSNCMAWMQERYGLTAQDAVLHKAPFGFDVSVWEMFWPLTTGVKLVLAQPGDQREPARIVELIRRHQITTLNFVPSMLQAFLAHEGIEAQTRLRYVICGGEAMPAATQREALQRLAGVSLQNLYGPTEAAIHVTQWTCQDDGSHQVPIGRPISATGTWVLDADMAPVPQGVAGELYLGGMALARGYLNRPGLTAERFVADPFDSSGKGRLYRTGDLVRWNAQGQLEYLGRMDHQVKIRGLRIELGEIEAHLLARPEVREAVVVAAHGPGGECLVGYVAAPGEDERLAARLRQALAGVLPDYMVPSSIVVLQGLPLNANGKVDRKALPAPQWLEREYAQPLTATETQLAAIWAELLGRELVGRHDHFFELGGHSLLALGMLERMRAHGLTASVRSLFQHPQLADFAAQVTRADDSAEVEVPPNGIPDDCTAITPAMLTLVRLDAQEIALVEAAVPGGSANIQDIYPLAPLQEGILFHHTLHQQGDAYATPNLLAFDSSQRMQDFVDSLNQVIARHDILRTAVLWEGLSEPVQVVCRRADVRIEWLQDEAAEADVAGRLYARIDPRVHRIDVRRAPMIRAVASHDAAQQRWLLQLLTHHLVLDHTTLERVVEEIALIQQGRHGALPQPLPFRRFVARARLGVSVAEHEAFFGAMLGDVDEPTAPFGLLDVQGNGAAVQEARLPLQASLAQRVRKTAQRNGVSAASLLHLAWALVMGRSTGRDDVVFGTVLFGRMQGGEGAHNALGMFINTLPLRVKLGAQTVQDCLRQTHSLLTQLMHHEHASLSLAQRCSAVPGGTPLFSALLNYRYGVQPQHQGPGQGAEGGWEGVTLLGGRERTNYPVAMSIDDLGDGFALVAQTSAAVGAQCLCDALEAATGVLVEALERSPAQSAGELQLLSAQEWALQQRWGVQAVADPWQAPVHRAIERQVRATPGAVALVFGSLSLSYGKLNQRANQLAHWLIAAGVGPERRVGIALERSFDMVVALLAVMKAGGAYVPLDPEQPAQRLSSMVEDSGIEWLLTHGALRHGIAAGDGLQVLALDGLDLDSQPGHDPQVPVHGENLAYVIFTSGSTGRPKGAANRHAALHNRLAWMQSAYALDASDAVLQKTPFGFDVSVWEFFWPLMAGARLVIAAPGDHRDPARLVELIRGQRVTSLHFVPSMLQAFLAHEGMQACTGLRRIFCSGEALPAEAQNAVLRHLPQARLYNLYGPTEAAIDVTHWSCRDDGGSQVPIGQPISGIRTYVLDACMQPLPQGVAGELFLGGTGLGRGYLNRPGLTADRFVADPFDADGAGRLYRTGDLVRWSARGQLEYLGRMDHQVKIRGLRIELGEVEAQLLAQPEVREAVVVVAGGPGGGRLVGHVSARAGRHIDWPLLRQRLLTLLPDYMVPTAIVVLPSLPLNSNGKVDRKQLPEPGQDHDGGYETAQGEAEQLLAGIWAQVLEVEQVGRHDNFFARGGDSILSLQIVSRAHRAGWKLTPRQLFEQQTIAQLATVMLPLQGMACEPPVSAKPGQLADFLDADALAALALDPSAIEDVYPLTPTQEGMLFHAMEAPGSGLYVNQLSVQLSHVDAARLAQAWSSMVQRHAHLRTAFLWQEGMQRPLQLVMREATAQFAVSDWRADPDAGLRLEPFARQELLQVPDWLAPPLVRVCLIRLTETRYQLIWTQQHIVSDGWSDSRLLGEWLQCYAGEDLPARPPAYGDYVRWLHRQDARAAQAFWTEELRALDGACLLAGAASDEPSPGYGKVYTRLGATRTQELQRHAQRERVTMNTLVQAAWALVLQRHTGSSRVIFGATVAGRPAQVEGAQEMLGLFINTIPIAVNVRPGLSSGEFLRGMQARNLRAREFEYAALADIQRWAGCSGRPLFDSIIVFENHPVDRTLRQLDRFGLEFGSVAGSGLTGYAMDLQVTVGETLEIEYCYARSSFDEGQALTMQRMVEHLLDQMLVGAAQPVGSLGWLDPSVRTAVLSLGQGGAQPAPRSTVHALIEHQAQSRPQAVALKMGEAQMRYGQLDAQANRLAHHLIAQGVGPDKVVAVALERSLDTIVTLLAVLKAGGAYLPLDIAYPADRLAFMLKDSGAVLLLSQRCAWPHLAGTQVATLLLDEIDLQGTSEARPLVSLSPDNLAYVIYTSGSTGMPKGVTVSHGPLAMHCLATAEIYGMTADSCELHFMSFSFDGAHERWLTPLCVGASLAVRDNELWTAEQTYQALHRHGVTTAAFPPAYLGEIAEWAAQRDDVPAVELYVFGGEAMPKAAYDKVRARLKPRWLINGYGPTETVVTPLIWRTSSEGSFDCAYAPIGRPVGERCAYVLDDDMQLLPEGMIGELYIGGYGLARGYLDRRALTAERFVADPFDDRGGRLYRTGDLVRWLSGGNIEYIGRADHQVKIRGFRIELGEVEKAVRSVAGVMDAAVLVHDAPGGKQLTAYVVANAASAGQVLARSVRQQLGERLPDYMVPAHVLLLPALPRLVSGKLDRHALPAPQADAQRHHAPPSTAEARALAQIWEEVLGVQPVGETDNFFELGGDSLLSLRMHAKVRKLGNSRLDFKLRDLLQRPTIAGLLGLGAAAAQLPCGLVALNAVCDAAPPLFCVHAGFGTVFDYQPLARALNGVRTVYAIPCRSLADPAHLDACLEQMADDYCRMVRAVQPTGPCHLLGWSLGGTLAVLMAQRLQSREPGTGFVGLVDPFVPPASGQVADAWWPDFVRFAAYLMPQVRIEDLAELGAAQEPSIDLLAGPIDRLLGRAETDHPAGHASMDGTGLAQAFMTARHLKRLSLQMDRLPALEAEVDLWWSQDRDAADRSRLERQLGREPASAADIAADHFSLMRHEDLVAQLLQCLSLEPVPV